MAVVHAPEDAPAVAPLLGLLRRAGVELILLLPDPERRFLDRIDAAVQRVVVIWSAALASGPDVTRIRAATGSPTGDRLLVLRLDATPLPPMLAGGASTLVDRCLRALAEAPAGSPVAALAVRRLALRRVMHWGLIAIAAGGGLLALVLLGWRVPQPTDSLADRAAMVAVLCIMMPMVAGLGALAWAWLDGRFLAQRVASYLVDRELEQREARLRE